MIISKTIEIDTGHRVPFHKGKCRGFHGHRFKIQVNVDDKVITEKGSDEGMVIDFSDLKEIMMNEIDAKFDHTSVYYEGDPMKGFLLEIEKDSAKAFVWVPFIPTAENLAKHFYELIEKKLRDRGIKIHSVEVHETPNSNAIYHND